MPKRSSCSATTSKEPLSRSCSFEKSISTRDRIIAALAKLDPATDHNHAYIQLIKSLSLPLNRLDKYANLLKEYLHNLEVNDFVANRERTRNNASFKEFHIDRGDAQRAAEYYAELAVRTMDLLEDRTKSNASFSAWAPSGESGKNGNWTLYIVPFMDWALKFVALNLKQTV